MKKKYSTKTYKMQVIKTIVTLFTGTIFFSINSFSQENSSIMSEVSLNGISNSELVLSKEMKDSLSHYRPDLIKYNSAGLDYRFEGSNSSNIGFTYRRFFKDSKYNLKASFFIGGSNYLFNQQNLLLYPTTDSTFIGVINNDNYYSNYQRLEVGLEKKVKLWKLNLVAGADLLLGHRSSGNSGRVFDVSNFPIEQNGITYYQYSQRINDSIGHNDLNYLNTSRNHLIAGAGFQFGMLFDITPRFYASAFISLQFYGDFLIRERNDYKNDLYKEHLPTRQGSSSFNFDQSASIGLHYRF